MTLLCIIEGKNTEKDHQTSIACHCVVYSITFLYSCTAIACLKLQTCNAKIFWGKHGCALHTRAYSWTTSPLLV